MECKVFLLVVSVLCASYLNGILGHIHIKKSTEGKDFMLAFSAQHADEMGGTLTLYIGAYEATTVRIEAPHVNLNQTFRVHTGMNAYTINTRIRGQGNEVSNKGIFIHAEMPIAIHALDNIQYTTDGYMALPLDVLSTEYFISTYYEDGQIMIAAPYADTHVSIYLRMKTSLNFQGHYYNSGDSIEIDLNKFGTMHLGHNSDFTGTKIISSKPVAVFSGSQCTEIPLNVLACDHLIEQMIPVSGYGKRFIIPSVYPKTRYFLRILSAFNNTKIVVSGFQNETIGEGDFIEKEIVSAQAIIVFSSNPVLAVLYSEGTDVEHTDGDPFMAIVPAISQFATDYTFSLHEPYSFNNYVAVTLPAAFGSGLLLGTSPVSPVERQSYNISLPSTNETYTVFHIKLPARSSHLEHRLGNVKFGALLYGFLGADSYGYPLGLGLQKKMGPDIRLVNGTSYKGRLEVFYKGQWGTVCDDAFDVNDAAVICKMLGLPFGPANAIVYHGAYFGEGNGPVIIDGLGCTGSETDLYRCVSNPWLSSNCTHDRDAGLDCGSNLRLTDGPTDSVGRLEILHEGEWGTVCNDTFATEEAHVSCKMLGFQSSGHEFYHDRLGMTGSIWLEQLDCYGSEADIGLCMTKDFGDNNCTHSQDVFLRCANTQIRLADGDSSIEGRLEIYFNGSWATVCDDMFDSKDAELVCRMLNIPNWTGTAVYHGYSYYGEGTGDILVDDLQCSGVETDLVECKSRPWFQHDCTHKEDVGVNCHTPVKLVGGPHPWDGRVEIFANGQWGTVCDDSFDGLDGTVICRMLGSNYSRHYTVNRNMQGTGKIWLDDLSCTGREVDVTGCSSSPLGKHNCGHSEDVGLVCGNGISYHFASYRCKNPSGTDCQWYKECFLSRYNCAGIEDRLHFAQSVCELNQNRTWTALNARSWVANLMTCLQFSIAPLMNLRTDVGCGEVSEEMHDAHKSCMLSLKHNGVHICDLCFEDILAFLFSVHSFSGNSSEESIAHFWDIIMRCKYEQPNKIVFCNVKSSFRTIQLVLQLPNVYQSGAVQQQQSHEWEKRWFPAVIADEIARQLHWGLNGLSWYGYYSRVLPGNAQMGSVPISIALMKRNEYELYLGVSPVGFVNSTVPDLLDGVKKKTFLLENGLQNIKIVDAYACDLIECIPKY